MNEIKTTGQFCYFFDQSECFRRNNKTQLIEKLENNGRNKLLALRSMYNLSQSCMAVVLGISVRSLQEYEQGRKRTGNALNTLIDVFLENPEIVKRRIFKLVSFS
jgi:DNA-binding transcriptional regulator YiaG